MGRGAGRVGIGGKMKKLRLLTVIALIACYLLSAVACAGGGAVLETPTGLWVEPADLILNWDEVENASKYKVDINGEQKDTRRTSYPLSSLKAGAYTLRVKALGDGKNFSDSEWSVSYEFVRDPETGLSYRLTEDEKAYKVTSGTTAEGAVTIENSYRGKPVVAIAENAFYNANRVTSVAIGDNVTAIGKSAFYNCAGLESVTLPESLVSIGENAFQSCRSLKEITIPTNVTKIEDGTFTRSAIERIVLPEALVSIGEAAFAYCPNLKEITLGSNVAEIGASAFRECTSLTSVVLPDSLIQLSEKTFLDCTALTAVDFGSGVRYLGTHAFEGCTSLKNIAFPENIEMIGTSCFYGCSALSDISLGAGISFIGATAFGETEFLQSREGVVYLGDTNKWLIVNKDIENKDIEIAGDTYGIAAYAFHGNKFESVKIPDSVQLVNTAAFYQCQEMLGATIGNGVTELSSSMFSGCSKLTYVTFGANVQRIGSSAFSGCTLLQEIDIPDTVTSIGKNAFYNTALWNAAGANLIYADNWLVGDMKEPSEINGTKMPYSVSIKEGTVGIADYVFSQKYVGGVTFSDGIKYIGEGAFSWSLLGYNEKGKVEIPASVTEIRDYTFYSCYYLQNVYLPNSATKVGRSVFYECVNLTNVHLPTEITEIPDYSFFGCKSLKMLAIPDKVQRIGMAAFYGCMSLGLEYDWDKLAYSSLKLVLPESLEEIGDYAFYRSGLSEIEFGKNLKKIGRSAFYENWNLKSVSLPAGVTEISDYAFYGCSSLERISMPNVEKIGRSSFYGCRSLKNLALPATLKSIGTMAFQDCFALETLVIPASVEKIGDFAFLCGDVLTIFSERAEAGENWSRLWNMRNRPVLWGCTLSADKTYVVSFTMNDSVENYTAEKGINAPYRAGYTFDGWVSAQKDYDAKDVYQAPNGTALSALWTEGDPEPDPVPSPTPPPFVEEEE